MYRLFPQEIDDLMEKFEEEVLPDISELVCGTLLSFKMQGRLSKVSLEPVGRGPTY